MACEVRLKPVVIHSGPLGGVGAFPPDTLAPEAATVHRLGAHTGYFPVEFMETGPGRYPPLARGSHLVGSQASTVGFSGWQ